MAQQILVPVTEGNSIEEITPYLENIAQPGTKVIFLVRSTVDSFSKFLDRLVSIHALGIRPEFLPLRDSEKESNKKSSRLGQEKILSTCKALYKVGAKVETAVYTGRFEEVVRIYARKGDIHLIVVPHKQGNTSRFLRRILSKYSLVQPTSLPPVLLLHPSCIGGRHG